MEFALTLFQPGMTKTGGRRKGVRNRLSHCFLSDLLEEWAEHGRETLKIARIERPVEFAKMVAGLLPREFELELNTTITEISDDELNLMRDDSRQRIAAGRNGKVIDGRAVGDGGTESPADGEQVKLLSPVPEAEKVS